MKKPTVIDLFAGAGGLSEGFRQQGFNALAANDFDEFSARTFKVTHPETVFLPGPIQDIDAEDFLKAAKIEYGELDCLVGGPPCQAFSVYNHQRGMHDERSGLFKEYLRIVEGLNPKYIVIENVTGMSSVSEGQAIKEIKKGLIDLGYSNVDSKVLKAEDFGVPQERRRIIIIANRMGHEITWPEPTHVANGKPHVTVKDALSDLPVLDNGQGCDSAAVYPVPFNKATAYQRLMRKNNLFVSNHEAPKLSEVNLKRMQYVPQGGSWRDIPHELLPTGMKRAKRSDHTKRYGRLKEDGLSSTVLTKCDIHWGTFYHPNQERSITVREAARLQSFPDNYIFQGPRTEQFRQVGNAVPPLLAAAVAGEIKKYLLLTEEKCQLIQQQ
ncbi:DNA cytosine methyltransferase [Hymenobacter sp. BT186]|uniref:Cytosine-specific methyltransferase n=1 Tax=Hymenobacter telluris TaxID=2816474 RepID=A0A939J9A2_9BACT|nr:DNA cytosine methyltransferase [Hymenobacter telluris]MBO0358599.1 DNA cytosine methyltransferase [Hymenobacter telluris]MBW3374625.1 DNA cytosine methyltransferase [Hymenobacter norwichensis]